MLQGRDSLPRTPIHPSLTRVISPQIEGRPRCGPTCFLPSLQGARRATDSNWAEAARRCSQLLSAAALAVPFPLPLFRADVRKARVLSTRCDGARACARGGTALPWADCDSRIRPQENCDSRTKMDQVDSHVYTVTAETRDGDWGDRRASERQDKRSAIEAMSRPQCEEGPSIISSLRSQSASRDIVVTNYE